MSDSVTNTGRRNFIKAAGAASALSTVVIPRVYSQGENTDTINVALIGCGGRGTGAAADALSAENAPLKLVAMADVFEHRLNTSWKPLRAALKRVPRRSMFRQSISSLEWTRSRKRWTF